MKREVEKSKVGTVERMAEVIREGLQNALPGMSKPMLRKLPLAIAAVIEAGTPNTIEISGLLPLATERSDTREQWLRRLLMNELLVSHEVMAPFAKEAFELVGVGRQTISLAMDQSDLGNRFAILMISVRIGNRSLPVAWMVESGAANIGFEGQKKLLETVLGWLPSGASVMLLADRFYPSGELIKWLQNAGWQYRLRLKGNLKVDVGQAGVETTGDLVSGLGERYEAHARLFAEGVPTAIGVLHEAGHREPWIIAMDCYPSREAVLDYGKRWCIEPTFSDFKSRGFNLEETHLEAADRLDRLILLMTLAMHWCVKIGREEAMSHPTPTEKKLLNSKTLITGMLKKPFAAPSHGSSGVNVCLPDYFNFPSHSQHFFETQNCERW